ncbi:MAG: beta-galactosidase, partial [Puniceicoccaceae bacterium]
MDPSYPHQFPKSGQILYGADYNPDQWLDSPEVLEDDIRLMKHLGVTSASIGIFSWTSLEPEEGVFCFDWLDATMERFERAGLTAFLATPSASKPNWLAQQHPEICRVDQDGKRAPLGGRHNHCPTSPIYRQYVRRINHELAKRYAGHPALGLWHIGNEFSGECHCELCRKAFQEWLKARYGTLEALNDAWWTAFWNSTFTAWEQIPTSDKAIDGLGVDWRRFMNDQHVSFLENEMAPLRELTPQIPCTTNLMGTNASTNYWQWSKSIDIISNDLYPLPDDRADGGRRGLHSDFTHSLMRGLSGGKPWILMECSPSSVNWSTVNKLKRPGVHMQEVLQAVANGADAVHYFQWRKSRGGFEKYHGAVVDHAGAEGTRVFGECEEIGRILGTLSPISGHSSPRAEVAMVYDWESRWALGASIGPKPTQEGGDGYSQACRDHFRALRRAGLEVDIISVEGDFSKYKLVVTPALYALSEATAQRLTDFAEAGGTWVTTYFTGYVDPTNRCWRGGFPGPQLRKVFGLWNEEVDYLFDDEKVLIKGAVCGPTGTTEGVHIVE